MRACVLACFLSCVHFFARIFSSCAYFKECDVERGRYADKIIKDADVFVLLHDYVRV